MSDPRHNKIRLILSSIVLAAMVIFAVLYIIFGPHLHNGDIQTPQYGVNDPGIEQTK